MKVEEYYLGILIRKRQLKMGGRRDEISKIRPSDCCVGNRRLADTLETDKLQSRRLNKEAGNYKHWKG